MEKNKQESLSNVEAKNGKCPFHQNEGYVKPTKNSAWWPNRLDLSILRQHSEKSNPYGKDFNYAEAFKKLNLDEVKKDLFELMTCSQEWWPADFGHYGPFFVRLAWHSAGTYRITDGRGGASKGTIRFAPLNSWPDNANLEKARILLWPIKRKYGRQISWADLLILAGNCALESMGVKIIGFAGGRVDLWESEDDVYWGSETKWLEDKRHFADRELENPLAAVQMGLIYVNPEGPNRVPDPLAAAYDIRVTFKRMGMNDEETVALIAGGHTFGKAHGAADPSVYVGPEPEAAPLEAQGLGWLNSYGIGKGKDTITSGLEGAWTSTPTKWSINFFKNLFELEWELAKSPAGAYQWKPKNIDETRMVPDAHDPSKKHPPMMLTTDLALKFDKEYEKISRKFYEAPELFADSFSKAWFKLTHRDMGPITRYLGSDIPKITFIWQDPIPKVDYKLIDYSDCQHLKNKILNSGFTVSELVLVAWASASTYRNSDKRGGANGSRIRLSPQKFWQANNPPLLEKVLKKLEEIKSEFDKNNKEGKKVSIADLIVLSGCAAIEKAAFLGGYKIEVPFVPGRNDALPEQTDEESFKYLEPVVDGFRNYIKFPYTLKQTPEELLIDKAQLLNLTPVEMTVLIGGMRVLGSNYDLTNLGVLTSRKGILSNDFFVNVLDSNLKWKPIDSNHFFYEAINLKTNTMVWKASRFDLIFGSHSELRAIAEVFASDDANEEFIKKFIQTWHKVMMLDRF